MWLETMGQARCPTPARLAGPCRQFCTSPGMEAPPSLPALLCLTQPRGPSAAFTARARCWLIANVSSTSTHRTFSTELRSSWSGTSSPGLFLPRCRTCTSLCWTPRDSSSPLFQLVPVHVPLNSTTSLWCISISSQFVSPPSPSLLTNSKLDWGTKGKAVFSNLNNNFTTNDLETDKNRVPRKTALEQLWLGIGRAGEQV